MEPGKKLLKRNMILSICLALTLVSFGNVGSENNECPWNTIVECVTADLSSGEYKLDSILKFSAIKCQLRTVIKVENNNSVVISGKPTEVMYCGTTNTGIRVRRATNFVLKNLILSGCGLDSNPK